MVNVELVLWIMGLVGLGLVLAGVLRYLRLRKQIDSKHYDGKLVFDTLTEYGKFKRAVGSEKVTHYSTDVLSSEPPIVVQFGVDVTPEGAFPYGEETIYYKSEFDGLLLGTFVFGGIILIMAVAVVAMPWV